MSRCFPMWTPNKKIFVVFIMVIAAYYIFVYEFLGMWPKRKALEMRRPVNLRYVVVHIDLKGAPPKMEYLRTLLPMLKENGVNALLMEYEDMFPYEGKLANLSDRNFYTRSELKNFVTSAIEMGFEVIPLIQTFGHLEFVLKREDFRHLREHMAHPDSICPSKVESRTLVMDMLIQVVNFHASISPLSHIHVGCDEVYEINECELCRNKGSTNEALFLEYIRFLSEYMSQLSPQTTILMWDDMFRKIKPLAWEEIENFTNIEPVYWHYAELTEFPYVSIMKYRKKFKNKWISTAFKGADGKTATFPNFYNRLINHYSWMTQLLTAKIPGEDNIYKFKGIILTGWSRYSHMDPLCELLPTSIPSLIANLRLINVFKSVGYTNVSIDTFLNVHLTGKDTFFSCDMQWKLIPTTDFISDFCYFDGQQLFELLNKYMQVIDDAHIFLHSDDIIAQEYYFQSKYINKNTEQLSRFNYMCNNSLNMLQDLEKKIALSMERYYENDVIDEYLAYKSFHLKKNLANLMHNLQSYLSFNGTWGRRLSKGAN